MSAIRLPDDDMDRRRIANRRLGWALAALAVAIFVFVLVARS